MEKQPIQSGAAISTEQNTEAAIAQACADASKSLAGADVDLAVVFASSHHAERFAMIGETIRRETGAGVLLGCTGESIAGTTEEFAPREIEMEPAIALLLLQLPDVKLTPMPLRFERTAEGGVISGWPEDFADGWPAGASLMLLADPFSFPADALLERINEDHPGAVVFGGMASGAAAPGGNRLLLNDDVLEEGAAALLLDGPVRVRNVVSQGCRPIGKHFIVTKAERNIIHQLGGAPAMQRLKEVFETLPARDQQLVQQGLHVGRVMNEYQDHFEQGDFLVKNVVGVEEETGGIAIADYVRVGQTVQFHVRDEESADAELAQLLSRVAKESSSPPAGALLFTCNGRGTRMFSTPNHDAAKVQEVLGNVPLAGFFAQGEIGPVGGKNYIHGFTASLALFEEPA